MLCVYVIEIKYLQVLLTVNYIYKLMLIFLLPLVIRYVYNKCKIREKKIDRPLTFDKIHVFLFKCWCILKNYLTMIKNKHRFLF